MSELVFATFTAEIKAVWKKRIAAPKLIDVLYDAVASVAGLTNKNKDIITVSKGTASKIMNRQPGGDVRDDIREHSQDQAVKDGIEQYFKDCVICHFLAGKEDRLLHTITKLITHDVEITVNEQQVMLQYASKDTLALFLGTVLLYTFSVSNLERKNKSSVTPPTLLIDDIKQHPLPALPIPSQIEPSERRYIDALMEVYSEKTGDLKFDDSHFSNHPRLRQHFRLQRKLYYAAESVRRGTRDLYDDKEDQYFDVFLREIYYGIIRIYQREGYPNGYERLEAVLDGAMHSPTDQFMVSKETNWVGNAEKMGACHFLVNLGALNGWVANDVESEII